MGISYKVFVCGFLERDIFAHKQLPALISAWGRSVHGDLKLKRVNESFDFIKIFFYMIWLIVRLFIFRLTSTWIGIWTQPDESSSLELKDKLSDICQQIEVYLHSRCLPSGNVHMEISPANKSWNEIMVSDLRFIVIPHGSVEVVTEGELHTMVAAARCCSFYW